MEIAPMRGSRARHGLPVVALACLLYGTASAQLEARIFVDKNQYAVGEPVFLRFELKNTGDTAVGVLTGSSYGCGGYQIELLSEPSPANTTCPTYSSSACPAGVWTIEAGAELRDSLLLNYEYVLATPGVYEFRASRRLPYGPPGPFSRAAATVSVEDRIVLRLEPADAARARSILEPYLADLTSQDQDVMQEAARVIGSLAPPVLEDVILDMMESPATRWFALLGLKRLNTVRSRRALANIVESTEEYSSEEERAIGYLSEMQDKSYFDLLVDEVDKRPSNQTYFYLQAAARLGGDDAVPYLSSLLASADPFRRGGAVAALPWTASRSAVPVLIDVLRSPDENLGALASNGLTALTHRRPLEVGEPSRDSLAVEHAAWSRWWMQAGPGAPIYSTEQCGAIDPL